MHIEAGVAPGSVEMQRVLAFTLDLKEVGVAGQSDAGIPDPTGVLTSWNSGDDWSEECGAVDVNGRGSHVLAYFVHPRMVAFADRVVIVSRLSGLSQLRWQAQFVERFSNDYGQVLIALVVDASAQGGVKSREDLLSLELCGRRRHA